MVYALGLGVEKGHAAIDAHLQEAALELGPVHARIGAGERPASNWHWAAHH